MTSAMMSTQGRELNSIVCCWMVRWEKKRKRERKRKKKDAVGSFAGKENSERPEKWNWDRFCTIEYAKINKHTHGIRVQDNRTWEIDLFRSLYMLETWNHQ